MIVRPRARLSVSLLALAVALATGAAWIVVYAPLQTSSTVTFTSTGETTTSTTTQSLLGTQGGGIVVLAVLPVIVLLVPTVAYLLRARRAFATTGVAALVLLAGFVLLTGFSIGLFYVPALVAFSVAVALALIPRLVPLELPQP